MAQQAIWQALCTQVWQLAALAAVVWLAARWLGRTRPHLAHALWLVVLIKCMTPPLWASPLGVFSWWPDSPSASRVLAQSTGAETADRLTATIGESSAALESPAAPPPAARASAPISINDHGTWTEQLTGYAVGIWLSGAIAMGLVSALRVTICLRRLRRATHKQHPQLELLVRDLSARLGLRQVVRLWVHDCHVGPAVIGLWRPTVLLPECVAQGRTPGELEPMLAHELIHVRRGDLWVGLLQTVAQAVWWFHPLVWLASRQLTREAERACDEEVLGELRCEASRYARSLLAVLEAKHRLLAVPVVPGVRAIELTSQRLERIMTLGQGCRRHAPWWCYLVLLAGSVVVLPGSPFSLQADELVEGVIAAAKDDAAAPASSPTPGPSQKAEPNTFPPERESPAIKLANGPNGETTVAYSADASLEKIAQQKHVDRAAAKRLLWSRLQAAWQPTLLQASPTTPAAADRVKPLDAYWVGNSLVLLQNAELHRQTALTLAEVRQHGIEELELEIHFLTSPVSLVTAISKRWTTLPTSDAAAPSGLTTAAAESRVASFSIEKRLPVILDVLDARDVGQLRESVQSNRRANWLQAPRLRLFNQQTASVADVTQMPFVVGFQDGKPEIQIVQQGISVVARPELVDKKACLRFEVQLSGIRRVENFTVPGPDGKSSTIQSPEVGHARIATTVDVDLDHTVLIGGLQVPGLAEQKRRELIPTLAVLITVRKAPAASDEQTSAAPPSDPAAKPHSAARLVSQLILDELKGEEPVYFVTYSVADLLVSPPPSGDAPEPHDATARQKPDFSSLTELIVQNVQPHTWDDRGGHGTIKPFPNNLSLVIAQTEEVHAQIAAFLDELRKNREPQSRIEIRTVRDAQKMCKLLNFDPQDLASRRFQALTPEQLRTLDGLTDPALVTASQVTLFRGQRDTLPFEGSLGQRLAITTQAGEPNSVRLAIQPVAADNASQPVVTLALRYGDTMLVDMSTNSAARGASYVLFTPRRIDVGAGATE